MVDLVRVVAVSPGDVAAERDVLEKVIAEINRGIAKFQNRRLELWRWETDAHPGLHVLGPQGSIDESMDLEHADVVIGIFWTRFGTPTHNAGSGSEHELRRAWEMWRAQTKPQVMLYFCTRQCSPEAIEPEQLQQVKNFRGAMPEQQLWWRYETVEEFQTVVRQHLTAYLLGRPPEQSARATTQTQTQSSATRLRFNVPLALTHFTGRERELEALDRALGVSDRAVVTQAITGLGGVGKSQLAARYLQVYGDSFDVVAWIRAEDGAIADLAALAAELGEPVDALSPQERAARALHWLNHADERWLLVLDNITSPEQLRNCCPHSGHGRVIITSRDRGLRQFGPLIAVDVFDEGTATTHLLRQANRPDDLAGAQRLASALGYLPLALSHAAAYCATGMSFSDYLGLLTKLPAADLFHSSPEIFYERTVASTWRISIRAAASQAPLAEAVLALAAHLAPDAIPRTLFGTLVDQSDLTQILALNEAIGALYRFSLIDVIDDTVSVHRLVQKTVRDHVRASNDRSGAHHALIAIDAAFVPLDDTALPAVWPLCEQLLPHALALIDLEDARDGDTQSQPIGLLNRACRYLYHAGGGQRAIEAAQAVARHADENLYADHPETLTAHHNVAFAYQAAGRATDAAAIMRNVLASRERVLGIEHRDTLSARADLAVCTSAVGHDRETIELEERVLADRERILGPDHPDTLGARGNLAVSYRSVGRIREAIKLEEQVLTDMERILGPDHPDTLRARGNLAVSYRSVGRIHEAIEFEEQVLADRERILGPDHPDTLRARSSLASSYRSVGRVREAIKLEEQVLADRERILGPDHPDTLRARGNLAGSYHSVGRNRDAIKLEEQVLTDMERILGPDHPDTLRA
ncbi:MAG: FxSxx-COOH system tetratricopeptide repeat protein, partial [Solirubrobacteraceae bacterium]